MATKTLTLTNLKAPLAKASGKPVAKTIAALWDQIDALPTAPPPPPFRAAPPLEMPDMYFPAGTKTAYGVVRLASVDGKRPERTFEAQLQPIGADRGYPNAQGWGFYGAHRQTDTVFGAHNDWTIEVEIDILEDKPGAFGLFMSGATSHPQLGTNGQAKSVIHVGIEPPKGYVHPPRAPKKARAVPPVPKKWDYQTDFLGDISDWHRPQFDLNGASGLMCGPETVTKQGRRPFADTLPIVDGVRRMQIVDLGPNADTDDRIAHAGTEYRYAMPSLRRMLGDGLYGYTEIDFRYPQVRGIDPGMWYWDGIELDHLEIWAGTGRTHTVSFHLPAGKPTYNPFGPANTRRTLCILRTPTRYAQWQMMEGETEKRLIVDGPNYAGTVPLPMGLTFEGPGGSVAGTPDPSVRYGEVYGEIFGLRHQQL